MTMKTNYQMLLRNFQAGTTTAILLIPQSMAYALVAGVPPVYGLYASLLPLVVYALLGRSRELALGPGALDTLLIGITIGSLSMTSNPNAATVAAIIAFQVAIIQIVLGLLRGGFLINFLSKPVISGFTSAAALTIAISQVKHLLGMDIDGSSRFYEEFWQLITHVEEIHLMTAMIGIGSLFFIALAKRIKKNFPNALTVVILATTVGAILRVDQNQVSVLGAIPQGLPQFGFVWVTQELFVTLLPSSVAIAAVGYLTTISIARTFADRNRYDIAPNRELIALGASNFVASFSQGFPVSASFSRSAVHAEAGSTSPYSLVAVAAWIFFTLLFLTEYLYYLPTATLAAIIILAVLGLIDFTLVKHLRKTKQSDMWLLLLTFFSTLIVGIVEGILIGVVFSLGLFLYLTTRPHTAILGRVGNTADFRNLKHYPEATTYTGVIIIRIDAQFYFGNVSFLKTLLKKLEMESPSPLKAIIIEACSIAQLDSSADSVLHDIADDFRERNIALKFASVKVPVLRVMKASGLYDKIEGRNFFMNIDDAVQSYLNQ
ncbi:sulfate permease [Gammaproteobacteria bacterium]|nr:sulfate permease [Gammaproteobacteria bacterium]